MDGFVSALLGAILMLLFQPGFASGLRTPAVHVDPADAGGSALVTLAGFAGSTMPTSAQQPSGPRIDVVFNNVPFAPGLQTAWGFAAVIEGLERTLLFDTGSNGALLLANMERMGIDPKAIEGVFLSHFHGDHTGGLDGFLRRNPDVSIYMPASFPGRFQRSATDAGARVLTIPAPARLFEGTYSTGPMGRAIEEQALVFDSPVGLVVMTGCSHPGIVEVVRAAKRQRGKEVGLLIGGFHLLKQPETRIKEVIDALKALGVARVAPSHCTGKRTIAMFRDAWGEDFVDGGCGAVIDLVP